MSDHWRSAASRIGTAGGVTFWVAEGDIAALDTDAVTNAANDHGWMGSGVAGALKRAGGESIEVEAMAAAPKRRGTAWPTGGGALPARHVIHAAAMGQDLRTDAALVEAATAATIAVARDLGVGTLAIPALGTGVGGFPMSEAANLMVGVVYREVEADRGSITDVVFAVFGADAAASFTAAAGAVVEGP